MIERGGLLLRGYTGYWVKEEVACHYFHKSEVLYRFLRDYHLHSARKELQMQYNYITASLGTSQLISHIKKHTRNNVSLTGKQLKLGKNAQSVALHIHEKHLKFHCETLYDAETLLFPVLRTFYPYLFIIENNLANYGWITPITMNRVDKKEQVLYSYL